MLPIFVRNWQTDECVVVNVGLSYVCSYCIIVMYHYTMRMYIATNVTMQVCQQV